MADSSASDSISSAVSISMAPSCHYYIRRMAEMNHITPSLDLYGVELPLLRVPSVSISMASSCHCYYRSRNAIGLLLLMSRSLWRRAAIATFWASSSPNWHACESRSLWRRAAITTGPAKSSSFRGSISQFASGPLFSLPVAPRQCTLGRLFFRAVCSFVVARALAPLPKHICARVHVLIPRLAA